MQKRQAAEPLRRNPGHNDSYLSPANRRKREYGVTLEQIRSRRKWKRIPVRWLA
ncbi:MAG: hypothetical protein MI756_19875 [Chromatiales bacterium]|nr:hypothetical protein [Chromatiales bacterium]